MTIFNPVISLDGKDTLADMLVPLAALLLGAGLSAIPYFQMFGWLTAILYTVSTFLILCCLRWWVFGLITFGPTEQYGPYIFPSLMGLGNMYATLAPIFLWGLASYGVAQLVWDWKFN